MHERWPPAHPTAPPSGPRDAQWGTPQPGTVSARVDAVEAAAPPQQNTTTTSQPIASTNTQGTVAARVLALDQPGPPAEAWGRAARAALDAVAGEDAMRDRARLVERDTRDDEQRAMDPSGRASRGGAHQQQRLARNGIGVLMLAVCLLLCSLCVNWGRSVGATGWVSLGSLLLAWVGCLLGGALLLLLRGLLEVRQ